MKWTLNIIGIPDIVFISNYKLMMFSFCKGMEHYNYFGSTLVQDMMHPRANYIITMLPQSKAKIIQFHAHWLLTLNFVFDPFVYHLPFALYCSFNNKSLKSLAKDSFFCKMNPSSER